MSWIRIDDNFPDHPKAIGLGTDEHRFTWVRILAYTCRYRAATIPAGIQSVIPAATRQYLAKCIELRLIDVDDDGTMRVHDWDDYQAGNPKKAARQARYRANLAERVDAHVDGGVDTQVDAALDAGVDASRASGARASRPVPSRSSYTTTSSVQADDDDSKLLEALELVRFTPNQRKRAMELEPDLVLAIVAHAVATGDNPGGLAWSMILSGQDPRASSQPAVAAGATGTRSTPTVADSVGRCRKWIAGRAWDDTLTLELATEELEGIARRAGRLLEAAELAELLAEWDAERTRRATAELVTGSVA